MAGYDVLILGAGLAGARAAELLAGSGGRVGIVEAKDAIGGRGYVRPFAGTARLLEFGGSWIAPWHQRIREACNRHGIDLIATAPVHTRLRHDGTKLMKGASTEDESLRTILDRLCADAMRSRDGHLTDGEGRPLDSISLDEYFARHRISDAAATELMAWWMISGGGDRSRGTALSLVASCAHGNGTPDSMMEALGHTLWPGTSILAERMIAGSRAELHLGFPVARVAGEAGAFVVTARDGRQMKAARIVAALPLNCLRRIDFGNLLTQPQRRIADAGHVGCSVKLWLRLGGVTPGILSTGGGHGVQWLFTAFAGEQDGEVLAVGFGVDDGSWDPDRVEDVAASVSRLLPDARLIGWDWHDWTSDPWARGTWCCPLASGIGEIRNSAWPGGQGLVFATSDTSPDEGGWFEGAFAAAETAIDALAASR